jgi:hypothetical protein
VRAYARRHAPQAAGRVRQDRRRSTSVPPDRQLSHRDSLLDHLNDSPESLSEGWARAKSEPIALPHRDELEQRFGRSLEHVQVYAGAEARSLLDALGAVGATRGEEILLTGKDAPIETVAHEVAHVLQGGPAATDDYPGVLPESHDAEAAADASAHDALDGVPSKEQPHVAALNKGWVALLRRSGNEFRNTGLDDPEAPDDVPVDDPPATEEADEELPPPAARDRQPSAPSLAAAPSATVAPETDTEVEPPAEAEGERQAVPAPERLAPGPDRQQEIRDALDAGQEAWDETSGDASRHEATVCPCSAVEEGQQPFVRGPPLDVPTVNPETPAPPAEPDTVDEESFVREADAAATRQLDRGPPHAEGPATSEGEQAEEIRELEREIGEEAPPDIPETPRLSLTGESDPALITNREQQLDVEVEAKSATALLATHEDFGETRLAPDEDPTLGHDAGLDELEVPEVSLDEVLPVETLDRVATDANAGTLALDDVLVARDEDMQQCRDTIALQAETRETVARHLSDSETSLEQMCSRSCAQRDRELESAHAGVDDRRTEWQAEIDDHVELRRGERDTLVRTRQEHIDQVSRDTDERASRRMSTATAEANRRWQDAAARAENKTREGHDPSWWEQGIDWFRAQLDRLRGWIEDFIDGCRRAIHALLEASREAAHAIVEAGHRAITATIELTRSGLDVIADNLPGELGAIARDWRDDAHQFLDGVQARVDSIAEDLHGSIDDEIDGLIEQTDRTLDGLEDGLIEAVDLLEESIEAGPLLAILRRYFPDLADLVERRLDGVTQWAAEGIDGWLETVVTTIGLDDLTTWLEDLHSGSICGPQSEESAEEACAAFEGLLVRATTWFDSILQSPAAQSVQQWLQEGTDAAAEQQVDQLTTFLEFVQAFAGPLYTAWQAIEAAAGSVMEVLGDVGRTVWRHVAEFLGIDPDIDPLTALRDGIQALWDEVVEATRPLVEGLREAWRWIRDESPIAWFINLIASLPELWSQLTDFAGRIVDGIGAAIAAAADFFSTTLLPLIEGALQTVSQLMHGLIDRASVFIDGVHAVVQQLLAWESGIPLLDALLHVVQAIFAPIVAACRVMQDCVLAFWRAIADGVANLLHWIRVFLDISVGIVVAFSFPPLSFITFFAGAVWLYLVPQCCKGPIINFFLDICIRLLRFLPEPADFGLAALYNGTMAFLETLRDAPDDQKVRAIDLFASIFAGNVEVAAGFLVGVVAGVWESTGGTLIFLVQALAWLVSLPFKLAQWAIGLATGATEEDGIEPPAAPGAGDEAPVDTLAPEEAVDDGSEPLGRSVDPPGVRAAEERPAGEPVRGAESMPSKGTTSEGASAPGAAPDRRPSPVPVEEPVPSGTREEDERTRAEPDNATARAEEREGALGPTTAEEEASEEETSEEEAEDLDEAEAGVEEEAEIGDEGEEAAMAEGPPSVRGPPPVPVGAAAASAGRLPIDVTRTPSAPEAPAAARNVPSPESVVSPADAATEEPEAVGESELDSAGPAASSGEEAAEPASPVAGEAMPEAPDLSSIGDFFRQLATEGFSREDVRALLDGIRAATRTLVRTLAADAARSMLEFLNNPASPFRIGFVLGMIAGMLVVEVVLAVLTSGTSTAVTTAKAALMASRGVARLASVVARLKRALQPLFEMIARLRQTAQGLLARIMGWLDTVVQWMGRMLRRFIGRGRAPHAPVRPPPVRAPRPPRRGAPAPRPARPPRAPRRPARPGRPGGPRRPPRGPGRPRGRGRPPGRARPPGRGRPPGRRPPRRRGPGRRRGPDRGGVAGRVRLAASAGWRAMTALARTRVVRRTQALETARRAASTAAVGISIRVAARHLGTRMWTLRVTGRRGRRRATVSCGRAWFGRDRRRQPWYSAAPDQSRRHQRIRGGIERSVERASMRESKHILDPDRVAQNIEDDIRRIEAAPEPRPLIGIRTDVDEKHHRRGHDERGRFALEYRLTIAPNTNGRPIVAGLEVPRYTGEWAEWNPRHPLLTVAANTFALRNVEEFGPYDLSTPDWDQRNHRPVREPRFELRPEYARYGGIGGSHSDRRWSACQAATQFRVERLRWNLRRVAFEHGRGIRRDLVNARVERRGMFSFMEDRRNGQAVARGLGGVAARAEAMAGWRAGREPRPLKGTLSEEDSFRDPQIVDRRSHIRERHVICPTGLPGRRHVAWRAAFDQQVGRTGIDRAAPSSNGRNAAYESERNAMTSLRLARNRLAGNWQRLRDELLPETPEPEFTGRVAAADVFAVNREGDRHSVRERPRYVASDFRLAFPSESFQGVRPLFPADVNSDEWRRWADRHRREARPKNPLTKEVTRELAFFLIHATSHDPGTWYGWYFLTLYPVDNPNPVN